MTHITDIFAEISELRAELAGTFLTRAERAETLQRLAAALAEADRRPTSARRRRHKPAASHACPSALKREQEKGGAR